MHIFYIIRYEHNVFIQIIIQYWMNNSGYLWLSVVAWKSKKPCCGRVSWVYGNVWIIGLVGDIGFEPTTSTVWRWHSTAELIARCLHRMELYLLCDNISSSSNNFCPKNGIIDCWSTRDATRKCRDEKISGRKPIPTISNIWCKIVPVGKNQTRGRIPDDPLYKNERQRKRFPDHRQHGSQIR